MKIDDDVKNVPGTYLIIDDSNRKAYVGSTGNLRERAMNHRSYLRNGKHPNKELQDHYNYCKGNLKFVAAELENIDIALELEQSIIDDFNATGLLCNKGKEADKPNKGRTWKHTEEQNLRKAEVMRNRLITNDFKANCSTAAKARGISDITRQKCKEAHCKQVVIQGIMYDSIREASENLNIGYSTMQHRLHSDNFPNYSFVDNEGS